MAPPVNSVSRRTPSSTAQARMQTIRLAEMVIKRLRRLIRSMGLSCFGSVPGLAAPYSQGLRRALMAAAPRIMTRVANTPNTKFSSTPVSSV